MAYTVTAAIFRAILGDLLELLTNTVATAVAAIQRAPTTTFVSTASAVTAVDPDLVGDVLNTRPPFVGRETPG